LEGERQEERWAERELKGFAEVREVLEKMPQERYAPRHRSLHINLDTTGKTLNANKLEQKERLRILIAIKFP
jgi:hypothetical protein